MVYNTIHSSLVIWEGRVWWLEVWRGGGGGRSKGIEWGCLIWNIELTGYIPLDCTLYSFMYMIFLHVHYISLCTWYSFMYTIFFHAHDIPSCTYSFMYTIFFHAHDIPSCTQYFFMYMIFHHVHDIPSCTWYFFIYIMIFFHVHKHRNLMTNLRSSLLRISINQNSF